MYKVMIVDDEFRIREGLKKIIEWEEYDTCIVAEARNGQEALEKIQEKSPDILIVDIEMPIMNGIELLKSLHERGSTIQSIILSGYNHFDYARDAMRYGAVNYLLKPLESKELALTLTEIVEGMEKRKKRRIREQEAHRQMRDSLLNRILKGAAATPEFEEKMEFAGISPDFSDSFIAVLDACHRTRKESQNESWREICETVLAPVSDCTVFEDKAERTVVLVRNMPECTQDFCDALQEVLTRIHETSGVDVVFSVGAAVTDYRDLHHSFQQAVDGLDYMIVSGSNHVIYCDQLAQRKGDSGKIPVIDHEKLRNIVSTFNDNELLAFIREIFNNLEELRGELAPQDIRHHAKELIISISLEVERFCHDKNLYLDMYDEQLLEEVNSAETIETLCNIVCCVVSRMMALHKENCQINEGKLPREIYEYVQMNYNDRELCLKSLAYQFGFSATHLGRLFKSGTGEYFSAYINDLRIQRAKKLLIGTDMKVKNIAMETGFSNVGYFCTIFKGIVGCNPADYRNSQI